MKLTKSQLKHIIKEELGKIQEGSYWVDVKGFEDPLKRGRGGPQSNKGAELWELGNLQEEAMKARKTTMTKELDNGLDLTVILKGDPSYVEGDIPPGSTTLVELGKPFMWYGFPNVQWVLQRAGEGTQMELPLETPPEEREVSPSMFSRIKGALGAGGKEKGRVAELLQKLIKEELIEALKKK